MPRLLPLVFLLLSSAGALPQDIRLTEFLATNAAGIRDGDGAASPWIELWNPSTTAKVSLAGWKLTDGAVQWTIPSIEILPDERLIVWASGKNRTVVTAPLHTNFTLPAAGGTLTLLNPAGTAASQFAGFPAQTADVSWGRDETDAAPVGVLVGRYANPTPGDRNNYSGSGVAGKVAFDVASQAFTGTLAVTLSQTTPDPSAEIRYTTDRSIPTASSLLYTAPLNLSTTTMLRARIFTSGLLPGETETRCYLLLDATTSGFSSPMPILVVTNFGGGQPPDNTDQPSFVWLWEPAAPDNRARFTQLPTVTTRTVLDRRGSSTLNNPKYNVNLEARKARDDDDRDVSFLGMASGSDYVLSGPFDFDRSEIHNPFIFALSRSINRYAPDTRLIEVFFDGTGGALNAPGSNSNDYFGIYNLLEKIRRDSNRVDVQNLDPYDNDTVGKSGGYIYKVDRRDSGDSGFTAGSQTMAYYDPKEIEIKSPQRDPQEQFLSSYINSFNTALQSPAWNHPVTGYAAWLDVPAAVDHHLLNVWPMNVDALRLSGYWHKERGGKLVPGPIWDFDRAMESADSRDDNPAAWRGQTGDLGTDFFNFTWWNRLFADIDFYQKYIDRWQHLRRGPFSQTAVNALLDSLNGKIAAESVTRDLARWGKAKRTNSFPNSPSGSYPGTQTGEVQRIKDWLQVRANFMDSQWVGPVTASLPDGNVTPGTQLALSVQNPVGVTIFYTTDGSDPRPSGGAAPGGASVLTYTAPITINSTTRIRARAYKPSQTALTGANNPSLISKWSGPTSVRLSTDTAAAAGNLVVTEINYHPVNPTAAELAVNPVFGDSDFEFVELRNIGAAAIDLGGVQLTAGIGFTFAGEDALSLAPGAFVVVAANPQAFAARYGTGATVAGPFTGDLANEGETLAIKAANNGTIANFSYDEAWFPETDGGGRTLALYNARAAAPTLTAQANWRRSAAPGGSPGANEPNTPPIVIAGADTSGPVSGVSVAGIALDDALPDPPHAFAYAWSKVSGPGDATFNPPDSPVTTASFSLPGVYILRLSANDTVLTGADDIEVAAKDTAAAWLARHPGVGSLDQDFDGDGSSNFAEFALGIDPRAPNGAVTLATLEAGHLTLVYTRIKPPSGVIYSIEVADADLVFRAPNPGEVVESFPAEDGVRQTVKVTDSVANTAQRERFIRLIISPAP